MALVVLLLPLLLFAPEEEQNQLSGPLLEYLCPVEHLLNNPVYGALLSGDRHLGEGTGKVRYFDEAVSPFAGIEEDYAAGFDDLYHLLPPGRKILHATPRLIDTPEGWQLLAAVEGLQFVFDTTVGVSVENGFQPVALQSQHIAQMMELAALTRPGPFGPRTIEFGFYHGIFEGGQLVAMTGQRLHVPPFTEISAVCTHPDHLGRGYAAALVQHQVNLILQKGELPFLHVRADNQRAIALYERLGFRRRGPMNFYFLKRRESTVD